MGVRKVTKYVSDEGFELTHEPIEDTLTIAPTATGYEARYLVQDPDPESPDTWGDESLFLVNYHRDFYVKKDEIVTEEKIRDFYQNVRIPQEQTHRIFPLTSLVHGGVWLKLGTAGFASDPGGWDTSRVGAVLVSKREFRTEDKARKAAESLVGEWNQYLSGDVYGAVVEKYDQDKELLDTDSVWGMYGLDNAKSQLEEMAGIAPKPRKQLEPVRPRPVKVTKHMRRTKYRGLVPVRKHRRSRPRR